MAAKIVESKQIENKKAKKTGSRQIPGDSKKTKETNKSQRNSDFQNIETLKGILSAAKFITDTAKQNPGIALIIASDPAILRAMVPIGGLIAVGGLPGCQTQSPVSANSVSNSNSGTGSNPLPVPSPTTPPSSGPIPSISPSPVASASPNPTSSSAPSPTPQTTPVPCPAPAPLVDNEMDDDNMAGWEKSSWPNGGVFNNTFKSDHISFNNGIMTLKLDKNGCPTGCDGYPFASGEYRTTQKYGYGYYETRMKAANGAGLVSAFFTYTGVWGQKDHHEIDFEVLGKDPTQVQLNYYSAGTGTNDEHVKMINLGFDASQGFHKYAFLWAKDSIEFFIDGKSVHKATNEIPYEQGQIFGNFWPGTHQISGWLGGDYTGNGGQVQYDHIKYTPSERLNSCGSPAPQPTPSATLQPTIAPTPAGSGNLSTFNLRAKSGFNGATGGISGNNIILNNMNSYDAGYTMFFDRTLSGNLKFNLKSGTCKIRFISAISPERYQEDSTLAEIAINALGDKAIPIPAGTNKINIMGPSSSTIEMDNITIE